MKGNLYQARRESPLNSNEITGAAGDPFHYCSQWVLKYTFVPKKLLTGMRFFLMILFQSYSRKMCFLSICNFYMG